MTAKTLEEQILGHTASLTATEESLKYLQLNLKETNSVNNSQFKKLEAAIEIRQIEGTQIQVRMAIVEKEVADFRRDLERSKGNRSVLGNGLIIALISAVISIGGTILTTIFFKPKSFEEGFPAKIPDAISTAALQVVN